MNATIKFLLFYLITSISTLHSQDWPVGTTWVYGQIDFGPPDDNNYVILEIIKDTVIQNQDAKILNKYYWSSTWDSTHIPWYPKKYFIKTDSGRVSLWDPDSSKFLKIYDFNLQPGDTVDLHIEPYLHSKTESNYVKYQIDSFQFVQTSKSVKRKYFYHTIGGRDCFHYVNNIIEDIGGTFYFFQTYCAVDPPEGGYLVCFTNGDFHYPANKPCRIPVGIKQLEYQTTEIYPNPSTGLFTLPELNLADFNIELYNQLGQQLPAYIINGKIDIRYAPGMYILKLSNKTTRYSVRLNKI
jgi:hypothetical protein